MTMWGFALFLPFTPSGINIDSVFSADIFKATYTKLGHSDPVNLKGN